MKYLLIMLIGLNCVALDVDKSAHMGTSYILNTTFYGINKKVLKMDTANALLFSAFTTLAIGAIKESIDAIEKNKEYDGGDMMYNALGVGLSIGTVYIFEF